MISPLYPILDAGLLPPSGRARGERMRQLAEELMAAGVKLLQYRNKIGAQEEVLADACLLRELMPAGGCTLILNDYAGLVVESGFDGVHLGQQDMPLEEAWALIGSARMLGLSTHHAKQLGAAERTSASYVAIGPIFATRSKLNPDPVVGLEGVRRARALTTKPLVAIGGVTLENCEAVREAGADSIAVISSLFADVSGRPAGKIASDFFSKLR